MVWNDDYVIPLINNVALTQRMLPTLRRVAGADKVFEVSRVRRPMTTFRSSRRRFPGCYFNRVSRPPDVAPRWSRPIIRPASGSTRRGC